ncbi:LOW QUALITY PROTEIN: receptor-like protein EIX1 [Pyrus x bretschneideri]|uniref:LOW QUALITY PROTEIN: receptor-like protein EIX1 n=1 Tax=Pyrus x bretschneideri TaxID=225117 RepID=UPI00202E8629|nr:LOW QUALITY PROTEIN: receptor-like protein EIX1 [Pyrus x bretschneideri]
MERVMRVVSLVRFLCIASITVSLCKGNQNVPCKENDRQTLLMFKKDIDDPSNLLPSWVGEGDCCNWTGVACDNLTGHVRELHLAGYYDQVTGETHGLSGKINPSLLNLKHLSYLDLSYNNFEGLQIPSFLGSIEGLRYLNLSHAGFEGTIPHQLGNISSLRYLDLSYNFDSMVDNLEWLSGLSLLKHLDMSYVDVTNVSHWLQVNTLPSLLVELHLSSCELYHIPSGIANLTSLKVLDLPLNHFNSTIPKWLYSLGHLEFLDLSLNAFQGDISSSLGNLTALVYLILLGRNQLEGEIPNSLGNLCKLTFVDLRLNNFRGRVSKIFESLSRCSSGQIDNLYLSQNNFSGHLSDQLGSLTNLRYLVLSRNSISGPIPMSLGNLSHLEDLVIHTNSFEGVVSEVHFANLTRLNIFSAHENSLTLKTSPNWVPPFQLSILSLGSWCLYPSELPGWLKSQKHLSSLNMSNTGISGTISPWLWNISSHGENQDSIISYTLVDLSHNQLSGEVPNIVSANWPKQKHFDPFMSKVVIDLGSNQFNGSLPLVSSSVTTLDLSNSSFSGTLSHFLCDRSEVPKYLQLLRLGNNLLTGEIPECWLLWRNLTSVNLENNNLMGKIPSSIGDLLFLRSLHLRNNNLSGELPVSLQNCEALILLDLGGNKFVGSIPIWFGQRLVVLSLHSNKFHGAIPDELCSLTSLQILDLAHNNLSGTIPRCFQNLSSMATTSLGASGYTRIEVFRVEFDGFDGFDYFVETYMDNVVFVTKGREVKYDTKLGLVVTLDLSSNMLSGEIPEELTSLGGIQTLNLSDNLLTGRIPSKIGDMGSLESLDLSVNQLFGEISPSISNLTFLSYLNLSYNNLIGPIPKSTQLQSFDLSSFFGNKLCGPPLEERCNTNEAMPPAGDEKHGEGHLLKDGGFYLSLGLGFALGFWIVLGSLLSNVPWSNALCQFQNRIVKKLYTAIIERY